MGIDEAAVRQVLLARYYLHLASTQLLAEGSEPKFAAINLFHEALETTLIACADHLNAKVPARATFENYLDRIDEKLSGAELPLRTRILQFNKARVAAKHHLTLPDQSFIRLIDTVVSEFISDAVRLTFDVDISEISLVDLIEDKESLNHLKRAQSEFFSGAHYACLISVRKAFYLVFEKPFDVREFSDPEKEKSKGILSAFSMCRAPHYAKSSRYIEDNVSCPFDYIVLDHSRVETDLMRDGIDVQAFWNVWRLTPKVYFFEGDNWAEEYDFDIFDDPNIRENCVYVLDSLIGILLQRQARLKGSRSRNSVSRFITIKKNARFFKKADSSSPVVGEAPDGVERINIMKAVPSLDGKETYWQASYFRKGGPWLFGYIRFEDTEGEPQVGFVADGTDFEHAISSS